MVGVPSIAVASLCAFLGQLVAVYAAASASPEPDCQAALLFKVDQKNDFRFGARLTFPKVPTNKGQYCIWIMVGEYKSTFEYPAMVQSGLFRWQPNGFKLQPFVALEHSGGKINTRLLMPLPGNSEEHYFRISRRRNEIDVDLNGKSIFRGPWDEFFRDVKHIYLRIASEVLVGGDAVSGTVRDIGLTTSAGENEPISAHDSHRGQRRDVRL